MEYISMGKSPFYYGIDYPTMTVISGATELTLYVSTVAKIISQIHDNNYIITLLARGASGCILSGMVAQELYTKFRISSRIDILRKDTDCDNHGCISDIKLFGELYFIDDLAASGKTILDIAKIINKHEKHIKAVFVSTDVNNLSCIFKSYSKEISNIRYMYGYDDEEE